MSIKLGFISDQSLWNSIFHKLNLAEFLLIRLVDQTGSQDYFLTQTQNSFKNISTDLDCCFGKLNRISKNYIALFESTLVLAIRSTQTSLSTKLVVSCAVKLAQAKLAQVTLPAVRR